MKIVQSFWSKPMTLGTNRLLKIGGWYNKRLFLFGSALSALLLNRHYLSRAVLVTDRFGKELFIDKCRLLFAVLGNYFPVLKRNLYIGIKTPWTLNSDIVWEKTHRKAGKYWFLGGIVVVICSLLFDHAVAVKILLIIVAIITLIPVVYSYTCYKRISKKIV